MQHQKVSMSKKKFRIGDLAKELRLKKYIIRFWEKEFDLESDRSDGGQRFYTQEDFNTFSKIKALLYTQGYTISGAKKQLNLKETTAAYDDKIVLPEQHIVAYEHLEHRAPQESDDEDEQNDETPRESACKLIAEPDELASEKRPEIREFVHHEVIGTARKEQTIDTNLHDVKKDAFLQQLKHLKKDLEQFKHMLG